MNCIRRPMSYWTTCNCDDCIIERRRAHKRFTMGYEHRVSQDQAQAVLVARLDDGWTGKALASATGLRLNYFQRHVTAHKRGEPMLRLGPKLAASLMTMGAPTEGQIGSAGTCRRLQALAAIGHGLEVVSAETGIGFSTLAMIRGGNTARVKAASALAVQTAYESLPDIGSNWRVRRDARAKGWLPPLAWDDIDDPSEQPHAPPDTTPDPVVIDRILGGDMSLARSATRAERVEVVRRWRESGRPLNELERATGWEPRRYVEKGAA